MRSPILMIWARALEVANGGYCTSYCARVPNQISNGSRSTPTTSARLRRGFIRLVTLLDLRSRFKPRILLRAALAPGGWFRPVSYVARLRATLSSATPEVQRGDAELARPS